ncbi:hypothetical protein HID58_024078, partial [Brassica napus]
VDADATEVPGVLARAKSEGGGERREEKARPCGGAMGEHKFSGSRSLNFIFLKQVRFAPILETLQGLVLNSNHGLKNLTYGVDVEKIRFMGILQRIAIAYFVAVLVVAFVISYNIIFILAIRLIYVPDSEYQISTQDQGSTTFLYCTASKLFNNLKVKCGVRGRTRL